MSEPRETAPMHTAHDLMVATENYALALRRHYDAVRSRLGEPARAATPVVRRAGLVPALRLVQADPVRPPRPMAERIEAALAPIVVGESNALAVAGVRALMRGDLPGGALYLYGPPGCGKSALLGAVAAFFEGDVRPAPWMRDNAHDASHEACLATMTYAFGSLAVGEVPPAECSGREALSRGLVIEIFPPDPAMRAEVLRREMARSGVDATDEAIDAIASADVNLHAAIGLLRTAKMAGSTLTCERAEASLALIANPATDRPIKVNDVIAVTCRHYGVTRADLLSQRRTAIVVKPRQIAMYLTKMLTLRSLPEIGRRFGGRDHTTVLHAVRKIEGMRTADVAFAAELRDLEDAIRGR